jgi:hypothetical protein
MVDLSKSNQLRESDRLSSFRRTYGKPVVSVLIVGFEVEYGSRVPVDTWSGIHLTYGFVRGLSVPHVNEPLGVVRVLAVRMT